MFEQIKTALATCTDEQKKQQLETLLSSPAYAHRIGRLNDLDSKISDMCSRLANAEIGVDTAHLGDIIQSAYMQTVFDVTKGADYRAAFDLIPESRVKLFCLLTGAVRCSPSVSGITQTHLQTG